MTTIDQIRAGMQLNGVPIFPVTQNGIALKLSWDVAATGPLLDDRVIALLPDIHLSTDLDGDIFRDGDATHHARFSSFLSALVAVRRSVLQAGERFAAVHLGDFYDVWRAYPEYKDHPTSDYRRIEDAYSDTIDVLIRDLDLRVCVGNHDASMALFPPFWARDAQQRPTSRLAYSQRFADGRILAFHGHQVDQVQKAQDTSGGAGAVKAATLAAQRLSDGLSLAIQHGIDLVQDFFGDPHLIEQGLFTARWPQSDTLADRDGFHSGMWCDRINMQHVKSVLEHTSFKDVVRLVFVGHSHRAGISAVQLDRPNAKFVPVIDCGSWAWGRSQFGLAVEGEVSLWSLTPGED